ncbi:hypothetical protein KSP40_PGU020633 [Platanthera guangdongensis]|uniref:J domain-containing protein n=1 Tax=Platanthera guangdongensis TaxID=2320717 RepID=A0ABR2LG22_9ASPA
MARKGSQPKNSLNRKSTKLENVIPRSLDASVIENGMTGENDRIFTHGDQSNADLPFRSSNSFTEQTRVKSGNRIQRSAQEDMSCKTADIAENDMFSHAHKSTKTNGVMIGGNCDINTKFFGSSSIGTAQAMVGSLDAISDWSFRYASHVLKIARGWIEHQKPRVSLFVSRIHNAYDYCIARIKFMYPAIWTWILHFGKLALFLSSVWLDCCLRGLTSLLHLGTASLFTVVWCSLFSIIGMVGFVKLLFMIVMAFLLLIFIGIAPAIFALAISATVVLWLYGSFWTTSLVTLLGGVSFGLHHERVALFVTMLYSLYCTRSYMGWPGLLLGLNLSFISSDLLVHFLKNNANEHRGPADCCHEIPSTSGRETELTSEDEISRLLNCSDHYTVLGFNRFEDVDVSVLKREYRKIAMLVHPDKNMGNEKAAEAFKKLQNAYEDFARFLKRKNYDDDLRREELLNYLRKFQTSSIKNDGNGIFCSESTHIEAEDRGSYGESRKIFCKKCGTFHIWTLIERSKSQARWCQDCKDFHQAKDGDGWLEQSSSPFLFGLLQKVDAPCAYICAESRIYNATRWFICQGIRVPANTHKPSFHVNINLNSKQNSNSKASSSSHRGGGSMPSPNMGEGMTEEDFFEWLQNAMNSGKFEPDVPHKEGSFN